MLENDFKTKLCEMSLIADARRTHSLYRALLLSRFLSHLTQNLTCSLWSQMPDGCARQRVDLVKDFQVRPDRRFAYDCRLKPGGMPHSGLRLQFVNNPQGHIPKGPTGDNSVSL